MTLRFSSTWDNPFYPATQATGGCMLTANCDVEQGGMKIEPGFVVDFGEAPNGPARCHETREPGGDCSGEIWQ